MLGMFDDVSRRKEVLVCAYDNIIQIPDIYIFNEIIRNKYEILKTHLDISKYEHLDGYSTIPYILSRDKKNLVEWLATHKFDYSVLYDKLYSMDEKMYEKSYVSDFVQTIHSLISRQYADSINIFIDKEDKRKEEMLQKIFSTRFGSIVNLHVTVDPSDFILTNLSNYTIASFDDLEVLKKLILDTKTNFKSILMPVFGYNYEKDKPTLIPKLDIYELCKTKGFEFGTFFPITLDESKMSVG